MAMRLVVDAPADDGGVVEYTAVENAPVVPVNNVAVKDAAVEDMAVQDAAVDKDDAAVE